MGSIIIPSRRKKVKLQKIKRHKDPRTIHPPVNQNGECKRKKPAIIRKLERENNKEKEEKQAKQKRKINQWKKHETKHMQMNRVHADEYMPCG